MRKEQFREFDALVKAIPMLFCRYYLNLAVMVLLMFVSRSASLNAGDASSNFSSSAGTQLSLDPNPEQAILVVPCKNSMSLKSYGGGGNPLHDNLQQCTRFSTNFPFSSSPLLAG